MPVFIAKDYGGNRLVFPKTENYNGLIDCLIIKTKYNQHKGYKKADVIRKELKIPDGPIKYSETSRILDYITQKPFKYRVFSSAEDDIIDTNIDDSDLDTKVIELYLTYNQYVERKYAYVENSIFECQDCGKSWSDTHRRGRGCCPDKYKYNEPSFFNGDYENYEDDPNNWDGSNLRGFR